MKYKLLIDRDFKHKLKNYFFNKVIKADDDLIVQAETIAVNQLLSNLSNSFETTTLTPVVNNWATNTLYTSGTYVYYTWVENSVINEGFYIALTDNNGLSPNVNPINWKEKDPRESNIVSYVVDITIYHLHCMLYPFKKNETLNEYYAEAIAKIDLLLDFDSNTNLVLKTTAPELISSSGIADDDYLY